MVLERAAFDGASSSRARATATDAACARAANCDDAPRFNQVERGRLRESELGELPKNFTHLIEWQFKNSEAQ